MVLKLSCRGVSIALYRLHVILGRALREWSTDYKNEYVQECGTTLGDMLHSSGVKQAAG